ncbi:MAG: hypothetical protein ACOYPR_09665 [Saprospiraceae bacterium]
MKQIALDFLALVKSLHDNPTITVEEDYVLDSIKIKTEWSITMGIEAAREFGNILLDESEIKFIEVSTISFLWTNRVKGKGFPALIYGGIQMKGFAENLYGESIFWDAVVHDTPPAEGLKSEFKKLGAFHKSSWGDDGTFGCFYREGKYPFPIYFFDNGNYYLMNMDLSEYYAAMIYNKAVVGWQYFYIQPEQIIQQLHKRKCAKWGLGLLQEVEGTRVDGVIELMNRLILLFPDLFPDFEIRFYIEKRDELVAAYNSFKNNL